MPEVKKTIDEETLTPKAQERIGALISNRVSDFLAEVSHRVPSALDGEVAELQVRLAWDNDEQRWNIGFSERYDG